MPSNRPSASDSTALSANETAPVDLDLAGAMGLVESALANAGVATTERERMACAKTLLRLAPGAVGQPDATGQPGATGQPDAESFAAVLRALGCG